MIPGGSRIDLEEAQAILSPYHGELRACVDGGWDKWMREVKPRYPTPTRRLRANAVWDGMVDEARVRFNDVPGVVTLDRGDRFFLVFDGRLLARFKKLDDKLRTRNIPTQYSLQLDAQMDLPAVPDGSMVTIGYRVNELSLTLKDVLVVMSRSNRVLWSYEIDETDAVVAPIPQLPGTGGPQGNVNRFRRPGQERGEEGNE